MTAKIQFPVTIAKYLLSGKIVTSLTPLASFSKLILENCQYLRSDCYIFNGTLASSTTGARYSQSLLKKCSLEFLWSALSRI